MASAMPVLPDVASMSVSPGRIVPRASARAIIDRAARSLTEPAGLLPSSFARTTLPFAACRSASMRCSRTSGVLPTTESTPGYCGFIRVPWTRSVGLRLRRRQLDDPRLVQAEDRVAKGGDRFGAGIALAPRQYDPPGRCRLPERQVHEQGVFAPGHGGDRKHGDADAGGNHVPDRLERRALERLLDARAGLRVARQLRADLEHLVAEAVSGTQQQHGLLLELDRVDRLAAAPGMAPGHRHHERLVVERLRHQPVVGERLGQDGDVYLALAQELE